MRIKKTSTDNLLRMAAEQGTIATIDRTWQFFDRADGDKVLMPSPALGIQLFRGQTKRHTPCFPSIARNIEHISPQIFQMPRGACASLIANIIRLYWFCAYLDSHPVFSEWSKEQGAVVQKTKVELAQHYGVPSSIIDLTESLEVALFFATHDFIDGVPRARTEGTGILYKVELPTKHFEPEWRFRSMAIGPFERPFRQLAWSCELTVGECFECCPDVVAWEFDHDVGFAAEIRARAEAMGILLPPDPMEAVVERVKASVQFPLSLVRCVIANLIEDQAGLPNESEESIFAMLQEAGFSFAESMPDLIPPLLRGSLVDTWETEREHWRAVLRAGFRIRCTKPM